MPNRLNDSVFRAYDIRGIYPADIDEKFADLAARGLATYLKGKSIAVSMDVRLSADKLTRPFIDALVDCGAEVWFIGVAPTPLLYFTIAHYKLDGGAAVSASHNPPQWNGFKMCGKGARVIGLEEGLEDIKEIMESGKFEKVGDRGMLLEKHGEVLKDYEEFVAKNSKFTKRLRVGIDPGNGACSGFASSIMSRMPIETHAINDAPDGRFPSRNPEPKPDTITGLVKLVKDDRLDMGVAFDGDGDRAMFVDDAGTVLYGDKALALFADNMIEPGDKVVYDVSCSNAVEDTVRRKEGIPLVAKVGHSHIESLMLKEDARLGGELSSHLYFRETYYFDDAFFAAVKMAELISNSGKRLSELVAKLPQYVTGTMEFDVPDSSKFQVMERIKGSMEDKKYEIVTLDGVKAITDNGWFIIRASNTSPKIKMAAEAKDRARVSELLEMGKKKLEAAMAQGA
jgi:phosphomannomutase